MTRRGFFAALAGLAAGLGLGKQPSVGARAFPGTGTRADFDDGVQFTRTFRVTGLYYPSDAEVQVLYYQSGTYEVPQIVTHPPGHREAALEVLKSIEKHPGIRFVELSGGVRGFSFVPQDVCELPDHVSDMLNEFVLSRANRA